MEPAADVVIVGGGIIGCAAAYYLTRAGASVRVLERFEIGGQASGAAAGILAPGTESHGAAPFAELARASLSLYPGLVADLRALTGIDVELIESGSISIALGADDADELQHLGVALSALGLPHEWLTADELHAMEPAITPAVIGGLVGSRESHVSSPRVVRALAVGAALLGARIETGRQVTRLLRGGQRVVGVEADGETIPADSVILATGAWAGEWGDRAGIAIPVHPIRGQILALETVPPVLRRIVFGAGVYLVSKPDGAVIVGATEDRAGFDARPTCRGVGALLSAVPLVAPTLAEARFVRAWAGLRPATPDHLPLIGHVHDAPGLIVAVGHYRNGVLLAPITGQAVTELVTVGSTSVDLEPCNPHRFVR